MSHRISERISPLRTAVRKRVTVMPYRSQSSPDSSLITMVWLSGSSPGCPNLNECPRDGPTADGTVVAQEKL